MLMKSKCSTQAAVPPSFRPSGCEHRTGTAILSFFQILALSASRTERETRQKKHGAEDPLAPQPPPARSEGASPYFFSNNKPKTSSSQKK